MPKFVIRGHRSDKSDCIVEITEGDEILEKFTSNKFCWGDIFKDGLYSFTLRVEYGGVLHLTQESAIPLVTLHGQKLSRIITNKSNLSIS